MLEYFSNEIKSNLEICKMAAARGYPYMSEDIKQNKEFILEIKGVFGNESKISKELIRDKDILKEYWEEAKEYISGDPFDLFCLCSVIGIDSFGNDIIDRFLKIEKTRHSKERIYEYEEKTEFTQFVKVKKYQKDDVPFINIIDFDKDIFDKELYPVIILVGEKENTLSRKIKEEYDEHCIIEIYAQDANTDGIKLITKDVNKIIDLLRVITYTNDTAYDIMPYLYNGLAPIKEWLGDDIKKGKIEVYKLEGSLQEITKKIQTVPENLVDKNCVIQVVSNNKMDEYKANNLLSKLYKKKLFLDEIGYISSHICNIEDIEIIVMKIV